MTTTHNPPTYDVGPRKPARCALTLLGCMALLQAWIVGMEHSGGWIMDEAVLFGVIPLPIRIGMWLATGTTMIVAARWGRLQPFGWFAAALMPVERCLSWLWSWLMWAIPGDPTGRIDALANALQWAAWIGVLIVFAGSPTWAGVQQAQARASHDGEAP